MIRQIDYHLTFLSSGFRMKKIKVIRFSERANTKDHREAIFNAGNLKLAQKIKYFNAIEH